MKSRSQENRSKVVYCHKHGFSPAYGPKDDLKCLRCAKDYKKARRELSAKTIATGLLIIRHAR